MKIYVDSDYICHTKNVNNNCIEIETDFFDGKCDTFIEGYRIVPKGKSWRRSDGIVFDGEMMAPHKPYAELKAAQEEYEKIQNQFNTSYLDGVNSI